MNNIKDAEPRWQNYFIKHGEDFSVFWEDYVMSSARNILFILGLGFDPRMCLSIETILGFGGKGKRDCLLIDFDEGANSTSNVHDDLKDKNLLNIHKLFTGKGKLKEENIVLLSDDGRRVGSTKVQQVIRDFGDLRDYSDIVIDISAMPRGMYLSLLGKVLFLLDNRKQTDPVVNLHVTVAEDADLDKNIIEDGIDERAYYVHGFAGEIDSEAFRGAPTIWIPVIGEGKEFQLTRINTLVNPDEICPVLPTASSDPRRGDKLLLEYRSFLFDQLLVEPSNIIHAAERNPFDLYLKIYYTARRYERALLPLDNCKLVVSALSSKLLSIGAFLSVYELKQNGSVIGIANIECQGYHLESDASMPKSTLFTLWLDGDCYERE